MPANYTTESASGRFYYFVVAKLIMPVYAVFVARWSGFKTKENLMSNLLIGKTIAEVLIADDKEALLFVTVDGEKLIARVDADCCSHTWIESVELPALGFPFRVIDCKDLDGVKEAEEIGYDYIQYYGVKLTTDKGDLVIDYRNSSNGFYGGNIVWPDDEDTWFYGGVHGQNVSNENWVEIEE